MISSRDVLKKLKADGWYEIRVRGDHHQLKHPTKPGKVTVQHPVKDLSIRNIKSIEQQSGVKLRP
jgi:predicted RNA binding protein YcfA (HicA-like mRNA interferase family)